jgi:hypothetical protein
MEHATEDVVRKYFEVVADLDSTEGRPDGAL